MYYILRLNCFEHQHVVHQQNKYIMYTLKLSFGVFHAGAHLSQEAMVWSYLNKLTQSNIMKVNLSNEQRFQGVQSNAVSWANKPQATDTQRTVELFNCFHYTSLWQPCDWHTHGPKTTSLIRNARLWLAAMYSVLLIKQKQRNQLGHLGQILHKTETKQRGRQIPWDTGHKVI